MTGQTVTPTVIPEFDQQIVRRVPRPQRTAVEIGVLATCDAVTHRPAAVQPSARRVPDR